MQGNSRTVHSPRNFQGSLMNLQKNLVFSGMSPSIPTIVIIRTRNRDENKTNKKKLHFSNVWFVIKYADCLGWGVYVFYQIKPKAWGVSKWVTNGQLTNWFLVAAWWWWRYVTTHQRIIYKCPKYFQWQNHYFHSKLNFSNIISD